MISSYTNVWQVYINHVFHVITLSFSAHTDTIAIDSLKKLKSREFRLVVE